MCGFLFPKQPVVIHSFELVELSPADENEETDHFSSIELDGISPDAVPKKREARPIIGLIMDILDTVYKSTKSDPLKRKGSQFT